MSFYDPHIFMCTNKRPDDHPRGSCGGRNAEALRQYLREKLKTAGVENARANMAGCMDQCENGPVLVIYPEGTWYTAKTTSDIDRIVEHHLVAGVIVTELQLTQRVK
jgi:(2Fe-2S) ferredoxin